MQESRYIPRVTGAAKLVIVYLAPLAPLAFLSFLAFLALLAHLHVHFALFNLLRRLIVCRHDSV